jgi:predicted nucleic acid-binding protein
MAYTRYALSRKGVNTIIDESDIKSYTVDLLLSEQTIAQLYNESDLRRAIITAQMAVRAKELDIEAQFKSVISAANKVDKQLANDYTRDYKKQNQQIPLAIDGRGNPMVTIDNFLLIMRNDEFYSTIKYNQLLDAPEITDNGKTRRWVDADEASSRNYIEKRYHIHNEAKHKDALSILMREREYHPIREIIDGVVWDGKERIATFVHRWLRCEDNAYTRECSRLIFAGGINRIYSPGCKFEDVVVFIGTHQGEGKSTLIRWLAMADRYYREISDIEGQKGMEAVEGLWIGELGEMICVTKLKEKDAIKAWISKQSDTYRKPYEHRVSETLRQCIFVGTINRTEFLTDSRNRRFYPVTCNSVGYNIFDNEDAIKADILQCWAEARFKMLRNNMPAFADRSLLPEIESEQEQATEDDWRIGVIGEYLKSKPIGSYTYIRQLKRDALMKNEEYKQDPLMKESQEIRIIMERFTDWQRIGRVTVPGDGSQRCWIRTGKSDIYEKQGNFEDVDELP